MEKAFHTSRDEMLFSYCIVSYSQLAQHSEQLGAKHMYMVYDDKCTQISDEGCFILHSKDTSIKSIGLHQQCYIIFRAFEPRVPVLPYSDSDCLWQAHSWGTPYSGGKSAWSENSVEGCAIFLSWKLPKLWPKTRQKLLDEVKGLAILLGKPWYLGYPIFTASSLDGCGCWGFFHFVFHDEICTCCSN